jgi:hypothetical protein
MIIHSIEKIKGQSVAETGKKAGKGGLLGNCRADRPIGRQLSVELV